MIMGTSFLYREVAQLGTDELDQLSQLLVDVVGEGASIGFLPPLPYAEARAYWTKVLEKNVKMWVAERDGVIVGTIQLHLATKPNSVHRAEIAKLMVHPSVGRQGIGRALLLMAEARARVESRSLLILDTRDGGGKSSGQYPLLLCFLTYRLAVCIVEIRPNSITVYRRRLCKPSTKTPAFSCSWLQQRS